MLIISASVHPFRRYRRIVFLSVRYSGFNAYQVERGSWNETNMNPRKATAEHYLSNGEGYGREWLWIRQGEGNAANPPAHLFGDPCLASVSESIGYCPTVAKDKAQPDVFAEAASFLVAALAGASGHKPHLSLGRATISVGLAESSSRFTRCFTRKAGRISQRIQLVIQRKLDRPSFGANLDWIWEARWRSQSSEDEAEQNVQGNTEEQKEMEEQILRRRIRQYLLPFDMTSVYGRSAGQIRIS
ncbi:hypothetical protein C8J56DRAFT_1164342 [Mycena floridula]|nr:hypothetical protein C8J56DRAFT_1164342 [Mycena floridula]